MHSFTTGSRSVFAALLCAVLAIGGLCASSAAAAQSDERSVPGSVVPSTGTTAGSKALPQDPAEQRPSSGATAGSFNGPPPANNRCATLRRKYAQSQACFAHYRLANGGLRPEAFKHCRQLKNPSLQCGSEIVG